MTTGSRDANGCLEGAGGGVREGCKGSCFPGTLPLSSNTLVGRLAHSGSPKSVSYNYNAKVHHCLLQEQFAAILKDYVGRESPLYHAERLSEHYRRCATV
jgi:hypothetical protein